MNGFENKGAQNTSNKYGNMPNNAAYHKTCYMHVCIQRHVLPKKDLGTCTQKHANLFRTFQTTVDQVSSQQWHLGW